MSFQSLSAMLGSPPRVRGIEIEPHKLVILGGITPARAGNRQHERKKAAKDEDHPRACGE